MGESEKQVICTHCGAENRVSMILSLCSQCRQPLEKAPAPEEERSPSPPDKASGEEPPTVRCPKCRELVSAAAERCAACGADMRRIKTSKLGCYVALLGALGLVLFPTVIEVLWVFAEALGLMSASAAIRSTPVGALRAFGCALIVLGIVELIVERIVPPRGRRKLSPPNDDGWRAFAQQVGASLSTEGDPSQWIIEADDRGWTIVIDTYTRSVTAEDGHYTTPQGTRCRVSYVASKPLGFRAFCGQGSEADGPRAARREIAEQAGGLRDIATGDRLFDKAYMVWGADEDAAKEILESALVREILLRLGEGTDLRIERFVTHQRRIGAHLTLDEIPAAVAEGPAAGVYVLCLEIPVLVVDALGLERMHELVHTTLEKLRELGIASEERPATHLDGRPRRLARE